MARAQVATRMIKTWSRDKNSTAIQHYTIGRICEYIMSKAWLLTLLQDALDLDISYVRALLAQNLSISSDLSKGSIFELALLVLLWWIITYVANLMDIRIEVGSLESPSLPKLITFIFLE